MVMNPMMFANPQQRENIENMQKLSGKIKYIVHTDNNRVEFLLTTEDAEAAKLIPRIEEGIVVSVTQMLYTMFAMNGERV